MKKTAIIISLIFAFMANATAQTVRRLGNTWDIQKEEQKSKTVPSQPVSSSTTVIKRDTLVIEEIIRRTDVIHRTEEVVKRIEPEPVINNNLFGDPLPQTENKEVILPVEEKRVEEVSQIPEMPVENQGGGNYIWIPDSMESQVMSLLRGQASNGNSNNQEEVNKEEMVTFRGRTLPMILKDRNLGRFDRGLFNYLFIPKGIWQIGVTASYGEFSTNDLEILDLVSDIDFNGKIWSIRPYFSYFFKSNMSLGLRLGYTSGEARVGSFNVDIDEDLSFNLHDIMYRSNSYSAAITFSQYLGITRRGRFGFFNEVELAMAGGKSDFHRPFNGEMRRTHTDTYQASLNFSPGLCVYVLDQVSFNVSFGVFGLNLKHEKQKVNDEPLGERTTSGANFRFNIFNINFGIAVNI